MTDKRDNDVSGEIADLYRSISVEEAPRALDEKILRLAEQRAEKPAPWAGLISWVPATALLAVVAISVAVIQEQIPLWNKPADSADFVGDFSEVAADGASRMRELGSTQAARTPAGDPVATGIYATGADAPLHCSEEEASTRSTWLACVTALEAAGRDADAEEEARRLRAAYPSEDAASETRRQ